MKAAATSSTPTLAPWRWRGESRVHRQVYWRHWLQIPAPVGADAFILVYYEQKNSVRHDWRRARGVHWGYTSHRGGNGSTDRIGVWRLLVRPRTFPGQRRGPVPAPGPLLRHLRGDDQERGQALRKGPDGLRRHRYAESHALPAGEDGAGIRLPRP